MNHHNMIVIINVFASLDSGGAENRTMDVYRNIDRTKYQFHFIAASLKPNQYFEKEIISLGGKIIKTASPREIGILKHVKELIKIFKQYDPSKTVVHSHSLYHSGLVLYAAKRADIKVRIAHARASQSSSKGLKNEIFIQIGKLLILRYSTNRFAVSNVAGHFLFGKASFVVIPNAIDIKRYSNFTENERTHYKHEFKINDNDTIIGHIGRLEVEKNHDFLLTVFHEYHKKNKKSKLLLIGDGTLKEHIQQRISQLQLDDSVIMCGIRRDANRIINIFNIIVFPSLFEGLPGVILEAQAAGIPCILSTNITKEVDLGLGIVDFDALDSPEDWVKDIENWRPNIPNSSQIESAFGNRSLSISSEIQKLTEVYDSVGT